MNNAGTSIVGLYNACCELGLKADLKPLDLFDLRDYSELYLPAVVAVKTSVNHLHFVTIHRFKGSKVTIMDPADGVIDVAFEDLWARMKRVDIPIESQVIAREKNSIENQQEILDRLLQFGISEAEAQVWTKSHGIFFIEDCLKYIEVMQKIDKHGGFGSPVDLLQNLINDPDCRLPDIFNSNINGIQGQGITSITSSLVLVVNGISTSSDEAPQREGKPLQRLFSLLWGHHQNWQSFAILALGLSLFTTLFPLASGWVIDSLDLGWPPLLYVLLIVGVARLFHQYTSYAYTVGVGKLQLAITTRLKSGLLIQFQRLPEWMLKNRMPGELLARLEESSGLAGFVTGWGLGVLTSLFSVILSVILLSRCWWPIVLLSGLAMVFGYLINEVFARRLRRLSRDVLESSTQFQMYLMELFRGLETIRLIGAGPAAFFSNDSSLAAKISAQYRHQDWHLFHRAVSGLLETCMTVGMGFIVYWGLSRSIVSVGAVLSGLLLSSVARGAFEALLGYRKALERQSVVLERCEEFLEGQTTFPIIEENRFQHDINNKWQSFSLQDVSYSYDERHPVLKNLDLELLSGRIVCLLGESGSGKSTLMDILCGLLEPSAGRVAIDGKEIDGSFRQMWGVHRIEQEPTLIEGTLQDNLLFGLPYPGIEEVARASKVAGFDSVVNSYPLGWNRSAGGRIQGLSGGETRRLCLARALLRHPRLLLLDETLSAVDWRLRQEIISGLALDKPDRCILLATHDPTDAFLCDDVIILEKGQIVEAGCTESLFGDPASRFFSLLEMGDYSA